MTIRQSLEAENLRPWHLKLALWIVNQPKTPTQAQITTRARKLCSMPLSIHDTKSLLQNPAFQKAVAESFESETARARSTIESDLVEMAELHTEAARALKLEKKWDKVHNYTTQYLDRAWPKADQMKPAPTQINITLGGSFAQRYQAPTMAEIVEVTELSDG